MASDNNSEQKSLKQTITDLGYGISEYGGRIMTKESNPKMIGTYYNEDHPVNVNIYGPFTVSGFNSQPIRDVMEILDFGTSLQLQGFEVEFPPQAIEFTLDALVKESHKLSDLVDICNQAIGKLQEKKGIRKKQE